MMLGTIDNNNRLFSHCCMKLKLEPHVIDHITLNFERQDKSFLQIVAQKEVQKTAYFYIRLKRQEEALLKFFCM